VGRFMLPLAENLDLSRFELFFFSDAVVTDGISAGIKASAHHWHNTSQLSDTELAELVRSEKLDVLIDLTMHMEGSRLLVFAQKPAPLQLTYLAYVSTTGLTAIDYRLSDPYLDPVGMDESIYSEKTLRLSHTYWCYRPPAEAMSLGNVSRKNVAFGCLNNYCKISEATWKAWIQILKAVPDSTLLIFCPEGSHREIAFDHLRQQGVDPHRLSMIARMPRSQYFRTYDQIDVALDPFPYGGGTTSLDALWAGIPVVSLAGQTAVGRGGVSILNNLGTPQWIANDVGEYVRIATELAGDRVDRAMLRERLRVSKLMDEKSFARDFEDAIALAWLDLADQVV
jgi:protein O-GlcNAc transferase